MRHIYSWYDAEFNEKKIIATSVSDVRRQLLLQNHIAIKIKLVAHITQRSFSLSELLIITKQLATMLKAGLPIVDSLHLLSQQHPKAHWQYLLSDMAHFLIKGEILSRVVTRYQYAFPSLYSQIISTGELTGQLDKSFEQLADQLEKTINLQKRLKKAMRYPLFLLAVSLIVSLVMLLFVLPQFSKVYESFNAPLPYFTQCLIAASAFISQRLPLIAVSCLVIGISYQRYFKLRYRQKIDMGLIKMPVLGNVMQSHLLAQIFQTLAITEQAGIALLTGLSAAANVTHNIYYQRHLANIISLIEQGHSFSEAMSHQSMFPAICLQLIRVGEESGTLELMLAKLATYYQEQNAALTDALSQTIEPLLMLILSAIIGSLIIAIYLPIFQLGDVIH